MAQLIKLLQQIQDKAITDSDFKAKLLNQPQQLLTQLGFNIRSADDYVVAANPYTGGVFLAMNEACFVMDNKTNLIQEKLEAIADQHFMECHHY